MLVEKDVFTFKVGMDNPARVSVSYSPNLLCQGLEKVSNEALFKEYHLKATGYWMKNTEDNWENKRVYPLEGIVDILENGKNKEN